MWGAWPSAVLVDRTALHAGGGGAAQWPCVGVAQPQRGRQPRTATRRGRRLRRGRRVASAAPPAVASADGSSYVVVLARPRLPLPLPSLQPHAVLRHRFAPLQADHAASRCSFPAQISTAQITQFTQPQAETPHMLIFTSPLYAQRPSAIESCTAHAPKP